MEQTAEYVGEVDWSRKNDAHGNSLRRCSEGWEAWETLPLSASFARHLVEVGLVQLTVREQAANERYTDSLPEEPTHGRLRLADSPGQLSYALVAQLRASARPGDMQRTIKNASDMKKEMENPIDGGRTTRDTSMVNSFDRHPG